MKKHLLTSIFSTIALLLINSGAHAQISVNQSVIEFTPREKIQDIEVLNTGDFKIYVDMQVAEIVNPESDDPVRKEFTDPRSAPLLVSPKQLMIGPGQRKRVRVILREPATTIDRVFRLSIKPYTGKLKLAEQSGDTKSSAIKVLIGYDLLLLARPANPNPDIKVTRTANSIEFRNRGNTNVLLRKITQCDKSGSECVELQPNRLYAGESYKLDLPLTGSADQYPVEIWTAVGLENSRVMY